MIDNSSSSGFVSPAAYSSEWQDITLMQHRTHSLIYTASRYGRRYILKALPAEDANLTDYRLQQEQELSLGIQLVHPHIAATYGLEDVPGIGRCIIQEWIDGVTLDEWLTTMPSMAARKRVFEQLIDALEYLHSLQLVHHDLKADNILITRHGANVKLIDFGLSALDATRSPIPNDPKKDIQGLGRLLTILLPRQRVLARRCQAGKYATTAALRRDIQRKERIIRILPVLCSVMLLTAAVLFFMLARHERDAEQQRYEAAQTLIEHYMVEEREELTQIVNRRETYDLSNIADLEDYNACMTDYCACQKHYWALRDSIAATYDEEDPLRELFWQMWVHKEVELTNELISQLANKVH